MAGTAAGSTAGGPTGPTKEQLAERLRQVLEEKANLERQVASRVKIKAPDTYHGERNKLDHFFGELDIYFTSLTGMNDQGKVLFAGSYLRDTAASWFRPYLEDYTKNDGDPKKFAHIFNDYDNFKEVMREFFGDT